MIIYVNENRKKTIMRTTMKLIKNDDYKEEEYDEDQED